jgi:hypothetical protein
VKPDRYIHPRGNRLWFKRRVPTRFLALVREVEPNHPERTEKPLRTADRFLARKRRDELEAAQDTYWAELACGVDGAELRYKRAVMLAVNAGFAYRPATELAQATTGEILARVEAAMAMKDVPPATALGAMLGGHRGPEVKLSSMY